MTLKLNGSSSGYTAIDAPAAAGSNTLVLPTGNGSAGQILQTDGSGNLSWVDKPTSGVTEVDNWRQTANADTAGADLTSGWERADGTLQNKLGTGMSESSGIFTFPSTGFWRVDFHLEWRKQNDAIRYGQGIIMATANNGGAWTYLTYSSAHLGSDDNSTAYTMSHACTFLDITDTSNHKVKFNVSVSETINMLGNSDSDRTHALFTKLAET